MRRGRNRIRRRRHRHSCWNNKEGRTAVGDGGAPARRGLDRAIHVGRLAADHLAVHRSWQSDHAGMAVDHCAHNRHRNRNRLNVAVYGHDPNGRTGLFDRVRARLNSDREPSEQQHQQGDADQERPDGMVKTTVISRVAHRLTLARHPYATQVRTPFSARNDAANRHRAAQLSHAGGWRDRHGRRHCLELHHRLTPFNR
jgi:hypothetical protein